MTVSAVAPRFVPKFVPKRVEATEILELRKHGLHDTPELLLNTAGFYDGLTLQLQRMEEEGFLPELVFIADEGAGALASA
jgi:hypothetical protein